MEFAKRFLQKYLTSKRLIQHIFPVFFVLWLYHVWINVPDMIEKGFFQDSRLIWLGSSAITYLFFFDWLYLYKGKKEHS